MSVKIYADERYTAYLTGELARADDKARDLTKLGGVHLDNAVVAVDIKTSAYGIFDADGKLVDASLKYRGDRHQFIPKPSVFQNPEYRDEDVIYLGNIYPHFGHFLLEHLDRAWAYVRMRGKKPRVLFINNQNLPVPGWVYGFMKMLGISESDVIILTRSTRFRHVIVPQQSFFMARHVHPEFIETFRRMAKNVKNPARTYDRVYLSRDKLSANRTYGEAYIQNIFKKNGFHIVYPETLPLDQQVAIVKNARVLAGCAGTALHLALFMRPGGTVIQLKRNTQTEDSSYDQYMLNQVAGHNSVFVTASVEPHRTRHSDTIPQIIGGTDALRRFLDDNGYKYTARDLTLPDTAWDEYYAALAEFRQKNGGIFYKHVKSLAIKIVAAFVPGRVNRRRVRHWLKDHL